MKKSIFTYLMLVFILVAVDKSEAQSSTPSETSEKMHHKRHASDKTHKGGHGKSTRHFHNKHHSDRGGQYHSHHHDQKHHGRKDQPAAKPDNK